MDDLFYIYVINVFVGPGFNFFNPWHVIRWWGRRKIIKNNSECKLTQKEANEKYFEGPPVDMA